MTLPVRKTMFVQIGEGGGREVEGAVPAEEQIVLTVNAVDLVGLMCTPALLEELALGFLYNEGLVEGVEEVADVRLCGSGRCVDVWLYKDIPPLAMRTVTSGCSGGTTFENLVEVRRPVVSGLRAAPEQVAALMRRLQGAAVLYRQAKGLHVSALAEGTELICVAEDIGRHNTIDKLAGICLRRGLPMEGRILVTSGRVSSEMLGKAARMGVPMIVSRTSPTSLSVELARAWGIALIGYARGRHFRVYAGKDRLLAVGDWEDGGVER